VALVFFKIPSLGQPTDNPYKTFYQSGCHWTDDLPWQEVFNITTFQGANWDQKLSAAQNAAVLAGGGVVYFPAGEYSFSNSIIIRNKVIFRGETPENNHSTVNNFAPPSRLIFPAFEPLLSGNGGDNSAAFRCIRSEYSGNNTGLVYLDINHATIAFQPLFSKAAGDHGQTEYIQGNIKKNVIVFGLRNNHAVYPNSFVVPQTNQFPWQRWAWHYSSNIDAFVDENLVVCNNRFNDNGNNLVHPIPDRSFDQPGYLALDQTTGDMAPVNEGGKARFNYNDHYVITVNRFKANFDFVNGQITGPFADLLIQDDLTVTPKTNSTLFPKGVEINDNWTYNTLSCAMLIAGQGMEVKRNVIRGKSDKVRWVNRFGNRFALPNIFLENRGIDVSGWDLKIEANDIQVYNDKIGSTQYSSNDGEGILMQECCGGSAPVNIDIRNNSIAGPNAMLGLYKTRDIQNVRIEGNNLHGNELYVSANTNGTNYNLFNVQIANNREVSNLTCTGSNSGLQVKVTKNSGTGNLNKSCYVTDSGNTGFTRPTCLQALETVVQDTFVFPLIDGDTLYFPNPYYPDYECRTKIPASLISFLNSDSVLFVPDTTTQINLPFHSTPDMMDSIAIYTNIRKAGRANLSTHMASFKLPPGCRNTVTLYGYDLCKRIMYSRSLWIERIPSGTTVVEKPMRQGNEILVFPNPGRNRVNVKLKYAGSQKILIQDFLGRLVIEKFSDVNGKTDFDISSIPAGIYTVFAGDRHTTFIKE